MNMKWWLSFSSHITLLVFAEVIFTHTPHTHKECIGIEEYEVTKNQIYVHWKKQIRTIGTKIK